MREENASGDISLKEYCEYLGQSPGLCLNLTPLVLAAAPFVLMGFLRFFIASWTSLPFSEQD